ncbi:MAG: hypothetical protein OXD01_09730, partial [Gammaproteobacteria bacterium]|nr:hypothetical protein [Gammaproteobacteria bacterium]
TFDIALLGVDTVVARGGTNGEVTLSKIADGMGITVHGEKGEATDADIVHDMPEDLRRYSGELDINLLAIGGDEDTKSVTTGEVTLTLAADENIEVLNVDSSATVGGSKRENPSSRNLPGASDYENVLTLKSGESENIEDIYISGDAKLEIRFSTPYTDDGLDQLDKIDASDNSGGITFSGAPVDGNDPFEELELVGGSGKDMLTGGAAGDEIEGNAGDDTLNGGGGIDEINGGAGGDMLNGGDGDDIFQYRSPSDSQVSWTATGAMIGFDTIVGFTTTADEISLGRTIYNGLHRQTGATLNTVTGEINDNDAATAATDNSLREWLGDGNGVFESTTGTGLSAVTTQHAVTRVTENYNREFNETEAADPATAAGAIDLDGDGINDVIGLYRTWILIDVNADGDFDSAVDMAIALTGAAADTAVGFALGDLGV